MPERSLDYRRGRSGRPLERVKDHVYATRTHCCRCGLPVDLSLPYRDPVTGRVNRWSKSIEHLTELDREQGNPYEVDLAHLHCNTSHGARYGNAKRGHADEQQLILGVDDSLD